MRVSVGAAGWRAVRGLGLSLPGEGEYVDEFYYAIRRFDIVP